jgi:hypothetical protein
MVGNDFELYAFDIWSEFFYRDYDGEALFLSNTIIPLGFSQSSARVRYHLFLSALGLR